MQIEKSRVERLVHVFVRYMCRIMEISKDLNYVEIVSNYLSAQSVSTRAFPPDT
jgi:hypothetical protein